jgi:histidyl-tRNA synthetase
VERLIALIASDAVAVPAPVADVYLVHQGEAAAAHAWQVAERLREDGLAVILHAGGGSFKAQLRRADASGARFAVVVGDDEARAGKVSLKPLREAAAQMLVDVDEVRDLVATNRRTR